MFCARCRQTDVPDVQMPGSDRLELAALIRAEIEVSQFRELQSDLEDTFLSITRQATADAKSAALVAAGGNA